MKLYSNSYAPNPRRVLWVMAEKAIIDIEIAPMDLGAGDQRQADFLARAGLPLVPQLELDDGGVIGESLAICRYLESLYPEPNLFGRDALESALIETWTRRAELTFANPLMNAVRYGHPALAAVEPNQSPKAAARYRAAADAALPLLERQLDGRAWLCGDRITIADIVAGSGFGFGRLIAYDFGAAYPNLQRWAQAAMARPGAKPKR